MTATAIATNQAAERPATAAKLVAPRADALRHLKAAFDKGTEIRARRIRNGDDLDESRGLKLQWVSDVSDLLNQQFDNVSVADYFNDYIGKVFPEYAEFGNFVEQFYEEMDYRLNKLRAIWQRVEEAGDPSADKTGATLTAAAGGTPVAEAGPSPQFAEEDRRSVSPPSPTTVAVAAALAAKAHKHPQPAQAGAAAAPPVRAAHAAHAAAAAAGAMQTLSNNVLFVLHGPKDEASEAVVEFVQQLGMAIVDAKQTDSLVDALERRNDMAFVIVMNAVEELETGKASLCETSIFKLGYCAGRVGLRRMCMMNGPGNPSVGDNQGIAHVSVDAHGGWQLQLARQMKRAGCDIDLNQLA
jgi:hypothetical protein